MLKHHRTRCWLMIFIVAAGGASAGCAGFQDAAGGDSLTWLTGKTEKPAETPLPLTGAYTVEIRREGHKTETVQLPHRPETRLQNAVEQSGAAKKFRRMTLYVVRTPPNGGPKQRMSAAYDAGERRVAWESDYAIYPGDHIVITQDNSSELDKLVQRFLGPLSR